MATAEEANTKEQEEPMVDPVCGICSSESIGCKLLPCQHVFCEGCLQGLLLTQPDGSLVLGCPTCQYPTVLPPEGTVGLPTVATPAKPQAVQADTRVPVCSRHNKRIQLFCETCEQVTCNVCAMEDHTEHQYYVLTRSNLTQHQTEVTGGLEQIRSARQTCAASLDKLSEREKAIEGQVEGIREEIGSLAERLVDLIRVSERKLLEQLEEIRQQKLIILAQQRKEGELGLNGLDKCVQSLENSLSSVNSSPHQFLSNKRIMMEMVRKYTGRSFEFEPAEKADLKFKGNGSLLVLNKDMGTVQHSLINQYCKPAKNQPLIRAGANSLFVLTLQELDGTPLPLSPSLFACKLHPPEGGEATPIDCQVDELQPGEYGVNMAPTKDGVHRLTVTIGGRPVPNSPFSVPVAPVLAIGGHTLVMVPDLQHPWGVAVLGEGELVAVVETTSHRLTLLRGSGRRVSTLGRKGKEDGSFTEPRGVAVTPTHHLLVTDYDRVQKLTTSGQCIRSICGRGSGPLQFKDPKGVAVHPLSGKIFVADSNNHRVQVLNSDLTFSHSFGGGAEQNALKFPWDVTCDAHGFVYVVDNESHAVYKFTPEGKFVTKFGSKGSEPGQLSWPSAISCGGPDSHLYVTDDNHRVTVFDTNGRYVRTIELKQGGFNHPIGVAVNGLGKVYISDCWNNRLVII